MRDAGCRCADVTALLVMRGRGRKLLIASKACDVSVAAAGGKRRVTSSCCFCGDTRTLLRMGGWSRRAGGAPAVAMAAIASAASAAA